MRISQSRERVFISCANSKRLDIALAKKRIQGPVVQNYNVSLKLCPFKYGIYANIFAEKKM